MLGSRRTCPITPGEYADPTDPAKIGGGRQYPGSGTYGKHYEDQAGGKHV